jgi:hypothetical protein
VSEQCRAVLLAIEDGDRDDPAVLAHIAHCARCSRHATLLGMLARLPSAETDEMMVAAVMRALPHARWQLRRVTAWVPAALGLLFVAVGLVLAGGLPGGGALSALVPLPGRIASWLSGAVLDVWAALGGGAHAVTALAGEPGLWLLVAVGLAALGGGWLVLASARHRADPFQ